MGESGSSRVQRALALAAILRTEDAETARACLVVLERVATDAIQTLTPHQLSGILEDERLGAAMADVRDALLRSGLFSQNGRKLIAVKTLALRDAYERLTPRDNVAIPVKEVAGLLDERDLTVTAQVQPRDVAGAIDRVGAWGWALLRCAEREQLSGFPVFWTRLPDGGNTPFGSDYGSLAASDTILQVIERLRYGLPATPPTRADAAALLRAWRQLVQLGSTADDEWYDGALHIPYFDDDFVGSFVAEEAMRGACPTLEAVAIRLYALVLLASSFAYLDAPLADRTRDAIERSAKCILRWQDDSGGWAIHRYPPIGGPSLPLRDVSCRYAVDALLMGLSRNAFSEKTRQAVIVGLRRFGDLLIESADRGQDGTTWRGDFVSDARGHRLRATATFLLGLGPLARVLGDPRLRDLGREATHAVAELWQPDPAEVFTVEFRSPTWSGPALSQFSWELPADALVLLALMDQAAFGNPLPDVFEKRVDEAVAGLLAIEVDGSWLDVKLAKAFTSNTLQVQRALLAFLAWQVGVAPRGIHAGTL